MSPGTDANYSLNWTARSSAIQTYQRCQLCNSPTESGSAEARGLSASSLPLSIDRPARMPDSPLDRTWHKVNDLKVDYSGGFRRGEGRAWAKAWALLDYNDHQPTLCHVGLMSLAGHGPKSGCRHVFLIIA